MTGARLVPVLALAVLAPAVAAGATRSGRATERLPDAPDASVGQRLYREGVLPSGESLRATAQAGTARVGADAACAGCHRRSGYGTSEGPVAIPPIAGKALLGWQAPPPPPTVVAPPGMTPANPDVAAQAALLAARKARIAAQMGSQRRPPYDDASLARAIRDGVDVTGRPLSPAMPRYALGDAEMRSLVAYLRTLSVEPSPGVTDEEIHFATVVQPGAPPGARRALVSVLEAFFRDKNAGTRSEVRRRAAGTEREYRSYRRWVLHVWDLAGPPDGWGAQLEALHARQPAFAIISGLGPSSWRPVHEFSERRGVPCLFPQVELPVTDEVGFYTLYLSRGIALEAEALAAHLAGRGAGEAVTQVYRRDDEAAAAAADAFRRARAAASGSFREQALTGPPSAATWTALGGGAGGTVVLWLRAEDLPAPGALPRSTVYLSSTLLGGARPRLAEAAHVRMVHPLDLPRSRAARLLRVKRWLHEKGIPPSHETVQMNAYFAVSVTGDAVAHMADLFSRDALVERLEHLVGNSVAPSVYPRVSLGPGQRFASKGSYIVELGGEDERELQPVSGWITP